MEIRKDLSTLSYEELEKETNAVVSELQKNTLGIDQGASLYDYGKRLISEMEKRLDELSRKVTDQISK
jgi:exonuclease VII small subunit